MDTNDFFQRYLEVAYNVLTVSQKPQEIEHERRRLHIESKHYVDYLEKYDAFFEVYPSLKNELFSYLEELKIGAFVEYQLDLFHDKLEKIESIKSNIEKELSELRNEFFEELKDWLIDEEDKIASSYRYLSIASIQEVFDFLNVHLSILKGKKEACITERELLLDASKVGERQAEEERKKLSAEEAKKQRIELTEQEKLEKRKKAKEAFIRGTKQRKKQ